MRVQTRPATPGDERFLRELFAESRPDLALLPEALRPQLIDLQFASQRQQYRTAAPEAIDWIVQADLGGRLEPVGRCYVWQQPHEHRLLDLAIGRRWRGRGIGRTALERLCDEARRAGVPLGLSVWQQNEDALRLYRRLGFVGADPGSSPVGAAAPTGYLRLRWSAGESG